MILFTNANFATILHWLTHHSYPVMLLGMIVEGPIITSAAAFATTLGYFNLAIISVLAIMGDVIGDFVAYWIGYVGRITVVRKFGHRFGISEERMEKLKRLLEKHPGKILLAIKISPFLPVPGIITIGSTHLPFKKFVLIDTLIILPKTLVFILLGYFFGHAYDKIYKYLNNGAYAFLIILVAASLVYYVYKKITAKISKDLEKD